MTAHVEVMDMVAQMKSDEQPFVLATDAAGFLSKLTPGGTK